jgi:hypothetical protein
VVTVAVERGGFEDVRLRGQGLSLGLEKFEVLNQLGFMGGSFDLEGPGTGGRGLVESKGGFRMLEEG